MNQENTNRPVAMLAETVNFDDTKVGELPAGWLAGNTGSGTPKWAVETDATAPSKPNVLKQSGKGTFPWCVKKDVSLKDGYVEVKFKPVAGNEDRRHHLALAGWRELLHHPRHRAGG